jgi:phosphopantetheinyl transferase
MPAGGRTLSRVPTFTAAAAELHIWRARLDAGGWPPADGLPAAERERAARMRRGEVRQRWVASRWALRGVLGRYLDLEPAEIELRFGDRGKPLLAGAASLAFNLSHSDELALVAVAPGLEVGVDVERIGERTPAFYADWVRREAVAKCHGTGLGAPLPEAPVAVAELDAEPGFAAAVAVAGDAVPPLRWLTIEPASLRRD